MSQDLKAIEKLYLTPYARTLKLGSADRGSWAKSGEPLVYVCMSCKGGGGSICKDLVKETKEESFL